MFSVAVIGAGRIGQIHAQNVARCGALTLKYVFDAVPEYAARLAEKHEADVADISTIFKDPEIAGVIIASPTETHLELSLAAAENGKAIFCEKPIDLDVRRAADGIKKLTALNACFFVGFNRRFDPHFSALRQQVIDGAIGEVEAVHIISRDPAPPPISYIASSGGLFKDMTIHDFDMARWLLNEEPVELFATGDCLVDKNIASAGDIDTAMVTLKTQSGRLAFISNSRRSGYGYDQRVEVFGSTGRLAVGNVKDNEVERWTEAGSIRGGFQNFFLDRYEKAYQLEIEHFAAMIGDRIAPAISMNDALRALELAEAANASLTQGKQTTCIVPAENSINC